jgi:hypothetical protein
VDGGINQIPRHRTYQTCMGSKEKVLLPVCMPPGIHNAATSYTVSSLPDTGLQIKLACACVMVYWRQQPAITISIKRSTPHNVPPPLSNPRSHTVRYNLNPISTLGLNFSCGSCYSYLPLVANTITDLSKWTVLRHVYIAFLNRLSAFNWDF